MGSAFGGAGSGSGSLAGSEVGAASAGPAAGVTVLRFSHIFSLGGGAGTSLAGGSSAFLAWFCDGEVEEGDFCGADLTGGEDGWSSSNTSSLESLSVLSRLTRAEPAPGGGATVDSTK